MGLPRCLILFVVLLFSIQVFAQRADKVFRNTKIYTANASQRFAEALAIKQGKIVYVGSNVGIESFIGNNTVVYDLPNKLVLPGIHDVHIHTLESASGLSTCELDYNQSDPEKYKSELLKCNLKVNSNGWIVASGHSIFTLLEADREPRLILDDLFPDTPIAIMEQSSHSYWVNSRALKVAGITATTPDPEGGHIFKNQSGEPNGLLLDNAGDVVASMALASNFSTDTANYNGLVEYGLPLLASYGITSMVEGRTYWKRNYHKIWEQVKHDGKLTCRVGLAWWYYPEEEDVTQMKAIRQLRKSGDDLLKGIQIKVYSDGIISNATAALHEPYNYNHGLHFNRGLSYIDSARLTYLITALEKEFDFFIHGIGDRGISEALDAIRNARAANGDVGARHRITHLEVVDPLDFPRFKQLNVTADMQVAGDFTQPHSWHESEFFIGKERSKNQVPVKSFEQYGARTTLSSDWSVSTPNPFVGIEHAVTRIPQEISSVANAVDAYTINGAYTMRQEEKTGSIEVGKYADIISVDQDIFTVSPHAIDKTKVELTLLAGKVVYMSDYFTGTKAVEKEHGNNDEWILYPSISSDYVKIKFYYEDEVVFLLSIVDRQGKEVEQQKIVLEGYEDHSVIDVQLLKEGVYYVTVVPQSNPTNISTQKMIISR